MPTLAIRDALDSRVQAQPQERSPARPGALEAAIDWLCLTHDVTGRQGSSKGFSLRRGWLPAYPETTGYVIGTLLDYAYRRQSVAHRERAREMGDWEMQVQREDGGVMQGDVTTQPQRSIVFNTGMVLHGWIDLRVAGEDRYTQAAERAARFLTTRLRSDGTWDPAVEYAGVPHTYNARVAWAMLRWAAITGDHEVTTAATRHLDWVLSMQRENAWFDACVFKPGMVPSTHGIAYTLRGLLESYAIAGNERYLEAARRTSEVLINKLDGHGWLPAPWDADWTAEASYACLTGTVQLGGVWLRLYQLTGETRYRNAGVKAVDQAASRQERGRWTPIRGALAGSFPIWGRYAPLQYPNWATKFLADSLMLREDCRES